jgi:putative acetyltransferase
MTQLTGDCSKDEIIKTYTKTYTIREIQPQDNPVIQHIVKTVLAEFGCQGPGWASGDPELNDMFSTYRHSNASYQVVVDVQTGDVLGGGGFAQLKGTSSEEGLCELQKLYFLPQARGLGAGKVLLRQLIEGARDAGYKAMYLESIPQLESAVALYEKLGFQKRDCHLGNTGHQQNCNVYMTLQLVP